MIMELKSIQDSFDLVTKKQKLYYSKTLEIVQIMSQEIEKSLEHDTGRNATRHRSALADLNTMLTEITQLNQLEASEKELNSAITKHTKALEKKLHTDIAKAYRNNAEFDTHILNQIIISFLYRQQMFDIVDCFISESSQSESESSTTRQAFVDMYQILEVTKKGDIEQALNWAVSNSEKLKQARSDLEFKLRSLRFLEIAKDRNTKEAIDYAKNHISSFADTSFPEIKKLACSLLWNKRPDNSPYTEFLSPVVLLNNAIKELTRQYCNIILGESSKSPLSVTVRAGTEALPALLKYMNVVVNTRLVWEDMAELPVDVELSDEFQFRSVFVCPVSREESSGENPPTMMPCGHVLCKETIDKMPKNESVFKCPYCPTEVEVTMCRRLHL